MVETPVSEGKHESRSRKPIEERKFVSEGMRLTAERLIENVRGEFEEFVEAASYLDLHLLYEVLIQHSSGTRYLDQNNATLGQTFMDVLGLPASDTEEEPPREEARSIGDHESTGAPEVPDWVEETPDEPRYTLVMFGTGGDADQEVDMSRDEFEILK
ncbi:MAG: hypothetical protein ACR2JB_14425, partial [Bryobacteraceae bacterium]